jgi:outer membrane lipoprotein-sorting protein
MSYLKVIIIFLLLQAQALALSPAQEMWVRNIEQYLNGINTLTAEFLQIDVMGEPSTGNLYLSRPGKLRWEYHKPVPILVVINGSLLTYYDQELKQTSHGSAHNNLIGFLARQNIAFNKDVLVQNATLKFGVITLEIRQTAKDRKDKINLIFNEQPLYLKKMEIIDEMGNITSIVLSKIKYGSKLDPELFRANQLKK